MMLLKVAAVSADDKHKFARLLRSLCDCFLEDDPLTFQDVLSTTSFSDDWKAAFFMALWPDGRHENPFKR
jgi:hypothetical protein